jgi:AcrR family transcriptional regulator
VPDEGVEEVVEEHDGRDGRLGSASQVAEARRPRAEVREEAILSATMKLLVEVGYDRLSIDGVAVLAHSSKTTIYRRWPDKAALVVAAITRHTTEELVIPDDSLSLRDDLLALAGSMRDVLCAHDAALLIGLATAMRARPDLALTVHARLMDDKHAACRLVVERAVERGELPSADSVDLLMEACSSMMFARICIGTQPVDDAFVINLVDRILIPAANSF